MISTEMIKQTNGLTLNEDNELVCLHEDAYIEKACCSARNSSGFIECACGGLDSIICPNPNCTGILDHEVEGLFEKLSENQNDD